MPAPTYRKENSRAHLTTQKHFQDAFEKAKVQIRKMEVRFLEEPDPVLQALLEIYISLALETPYNEFKTT